MLPTSLLVEIMTFFDLKFVASTCSVVSSSWRVATEVWFASSEGAYSIFKVGIALELGLDHRKISEEAGERLIVRAAERGCCVADAYCDLEGWGEEKPRLNHMEQRERVPHHKRAVDNLLSDIKRADEETKRPRVPTAWSAFLIGYCLYHGYGGKDGKGKLPNHSAAVSWYRRACDENLCVAQNHLALMYLHDEGELKCGTKERARCTGEDDPEMREMVEEMMLEAARSGNCRAKYGYATMKRTAVNRGWKCEEMKRMLIESAEQGHEEAQYDVGIFYSDCEDKYEQSVLLFQLAAGQGCKNSEFELGNIFLHGKCGRATDLEIALAWFIRAAGQGHRGAQTSVDALAEGGVTLEDFIGV